MPTIHDLPQLNADENTRSALLTNEIRDHITDIGGAIPFAKYMELALYHPLLGYYNANDFTLGENGDFITAPLISTLFAQCFARQIMEIANQIDTHSILELGAGTGHLAKDILLYLHGIKHLPDQYFIYEISPRLRQKQQDFLRTHCPQFLKRVIWLDELPAEFCGTIIANEVLDAMPTNLFRIANGSVQERCVIWDKHQFRFQFCQPLSSGLHEYVSRINEFYQLSEDYQSEATLLLQPFVYQLASCLRQGVILLADYGYGEAEYYHPERHRGTLTCFYRHRRHDNPFILPGLQDITAHVNFSSVIESAADAGCTLGGYTTQAAFLLSCGLMEIATKEAEHLSYIDQFNLSQGIKTLTLPTEMGERVKLMALTKQVNAPLLGFSFQDRRREL